MTGKYPDSLTNALGEALADVLANMEQDRKYGYVWTGAIRIEEYNRWASVLDEYETRRDEKRSES